MIDVFFFFNDTATTEIYTLSLHDALPIWAAARGAGGLAGADRDEYGRGAAAGLRRAAGRDVHPAPLSGAAFSWDSSSFNAVRTAVARSRPTLRYTSWPLLPRITRYSRAPSAVLRAY